MWLHNRGLHPLVEGSFIGKVPSGKVAYFKYRVQYSVGPSYCGRDQAISKGIIAIYEMYYLFVTIETVCLKGVMPMHARVCDTV